MNPKEQHRISAPNVALLTLFGVLLDVLQFVIGFLFGLVPVVGIPIAWLLPSVLIAVPGGISISIWFMLLRVNQFNSTKKMAEQMITKLSEFLPLLNALPMITFSIVYTIRVARKEDREYNEKMRAALTGAQALMQAQAVRAYQMEQEVANDNRAREEAERTAQAYNAYQAMEQPEAANENEPMAEDGRSRRMPEMKYPRAA